MGCHCLLRIYALLHHKLYFDVKASILIFLCRLFLRNKCLQGDISDGDDGAGITVLKSLCMNNSPSCLCVSVFRFRLPLLLVELGLDDEQLCLLLLYFLSLCFMEAALSSISPQQTNPAPCFMVHLNGTIARY